ncbi:MAG: hypothetical protein HON53_12900 [Planctomycetaceae bacterium]|jgi:hypothetical protein|nr:hypothetical protein [Planctomycetaceae bacterium]MBT6157927.1 hypothetical protein [Planctomycetaceae bacterium]MBT6487453.1 hypothetical protein [Planctomycetaceae bacterium]MBT6495572.1 hypothetical protein [Planctomycetaceae bacterium]
MPTAIEKTLKIVLKYKEQSSRRALDRALEAQWYITQQARKKRTRTAALKALRQIASEATTRMRSQVGFCLLDLASPEYSDLEPDLRAALADPIMCLDAARGLYRIADAKSFPAIVDAIGDKALGITHRVQLLDFLAYRSAHPWDRSIPATLSGVADRHIPVKQLKAWVAEGCPVGEPIIEVPTAKLKMLGVKLPSDYTKFLKRFRGGIPYKDRSGDLWFLTPARLLLTERHFRETQAPCIQVMQAFVESDGDIYLGSSSREKAVRDRLNRGIVIGSSWESGTEQLLFLDVTDECSVWNVSMPHLEFRRKGATFDDWLRKVKPAALSDSQDLDAVAFLAATGCLPQFDDEEDWYTSLFIYGLPVSDDVLVALRKLTNLASLYWNNINDPNINDAMHVISTLIFLDELHLIRTPLADKGLTHLKTLWDIKKISAWGTKVTGKGVSELKQMLPQVEIVTADPYAAPKGDDETPTYRCPVSRCTGWVDFIEDKDEGDFWGCGECGSSWRKRKNFFAEISAIVKKYKYRQASYRKSGRNWEPDDDNQEPDDYEDLVEQEEPDTADDFERG